MFRSLVDQTHGEAPATRNATRRSGLAAAATGAQAAAVMVVVGLPTTAVPATVFSDNFEDGNTDGWSKSGGTWTVVADGTQAARQSNATSENARLFAGSVPAAG
ncbi:hypothetical protein [Micromonospora fulviviridis]|uniref:hypothetical protein n=1 Tax=Micromonospora fulviviridis TaxID=47860 RepID=UPI0037BD7CB7